MVSGLLQKDLFTEEGEVWRKVSNKIIVTFVTQTHVFFPLSSCCVS